MFFLRMMEHNDLTVTAEGLVSSLDYALWDMKVVSEALEDEYYHKFRRFDQVVGTTSSEHLKPQHHGYREVDKTPSMRMADFIEYLDLRKTCLQQQQQQPELEVNASTERMQVHEIQFQRRTK
jgi:hypothetical protein